MCGSQVLDLLAHDTEAGAFKRSVFLSASIKSSCSQFSILYRSIFLSRVAFTHIFSFQVLAGYLVIFLKFIIKEKKDQVKD